MFCLSRGCHVFRFSKPIKTRTVSSRLTWTVSRGRLEGRDLWKPALFAVGFSGATFTTSAIWTYESNKHTLRNRFQSPFAQKKKNHSGIFDRFTDGQKVVFGIAAVNLMVFAAWRVRGWTPFMMRYFTSNPVSQSICLPMILSSFSHHSLLHLGVNMFVLHSFAQTSVSVFGKEQFLAFYLSSGVFASLGSLAYKVLTGVAQGSVGASGAILGIIASHCLLFPSSQIQIVFLPFFAFSAASAIKGVMALDFAGMLFRWSFFDHAGHFFGALFGIFYLNYGQSLYVKYGSQVMRKWSGISPPKNS